MGLILSSFARSLVASSHSLLIDFGGGGAVHFFLKGKKKGGGKLM
jgi:hypothetical protein